MARWRDVVDLFAEHGDPYETARSRWRLAEVLLAAGDREAPEVLGAARDTASSLGAVPLVEALDRLAPRRPRATTNLTVREAEVLALVAEGRSNGEIGVPCSSAPRRPACTCPTSWLLSARHRGARPWRWAGAPRACSTTEPTLSRPTPTRHGYRFRRAGVQREDAVGQADHEQAGTEHVGDDQRLGQVGEVLHVAD